MVNLTENLTLLKMLSYNEIILVMVCQKIFVHTCVGESTSGVFCLCCGLSPAGNLAATHSFPTSHPKVGLQGGSGKM